MDLRYILEKKAAEGAQSPQSLPNSKQSLPLHTKKLICCDGVACFWISPSRGRLRKINGHYDI